MEIEKEKIIEVLNGIRHPESKQSIVSLGMVRDVQYREGNLWLGLQFSRANDPFIQSIKKACMRAVNHAFGEDTLKKGHIQVVVPESPAHE
jgi:ATP-binding protein involved in chromosome partitioning